MVSADMAPGTRMEESSIGSVSCARWWCTARGLAQRRRDEEDGRGDQEVICEKADVD